MKNTKIPGLVSSIFISILNYWHNQPSSFVFRCRNVFNRIVQMGLASKRMKFIFKKFLEFEKSHGSEDSVDRVKEMAVKYVEKSTTGAKNAEDNSLPNGQHELKMQENLKKNLNL
jgi:hypothetical protein